MASSATGLKLVDLGFRSLRSVVEESEVAAFVGLGDLLDVELPIAALDLGFGGFPFRPAVLQFFVADVEMKFSACNVEFNYVAVAHESEWSAHSRLG